MSSGRSGPPVALPLHELLEALREEGLPIGVREHLTVGRLLARWPNCDTAELRSALAALLARNPRESQRVLDTFDRLYTRPLAGQPNVDDEEGPPPGGMARALAAVATTDVGDEEDPPPSPPPPPFWRRLTTIRSAVAALLLLPVAIAVSLYIEGVRRPAVEPLPSEVPTPTAVVEDAEPAPRIEERETTDERLNWWKAGGLALLGAAVGLAFVYRRRTGEEARRFMRRRWTGELDALPGPATYELKLRLPEPPFRPDLLDDVASVLGRHLDHTLKGTELDVDRTLARTLRAGLAPHVVWSARALSLPVLVLEDVGADMWPWRHRVAALLDGLAARGVALERWQFDADAARLFQRAGGSPATLRQLARRRSEHPLLVISAGQGIREGEDRKLADWVGLLRHWRSRAWLHPVNDLRYWRSEMSEVGLFAWPMTPQGVLSAAQQLARGEARLREVRDIGVAADRPVAPLDVERLRWLLSLAPRRDPELAELLRQRFCPHVPHAALLEALAASMAPATGATESARNGKTGDHPGVGPSAAEVHAFLAAVLVESEPAPGTGAHVRWRLDRDLQEIHSGQEEVSARARRDLAELARGPAAPLVEDAADRAGLEPALERDLLAPLDRRAHREAWDEAARGSKAWIRPRAPELVAALVCGVITLAATTRVDVLTHDVVTRGQEVYLLELVTVGGPPRLALSRRPGVTDVTLAPDVGVLMASSADAGEYQSSTFDLRATGRSTFTIPPESLSDHYFWMRADRSDGLVALSNIVPVDIAVQPSLAATATSLPPTAGPTAAVTPGAGATDTPILTPTERPSRPPVRGPAIDSVSPERITTLGFTELVLRGTGFDPGAIVYIKWGGLDTPTSSNYRSANELLVPIAINANSPSGTVGLIVRNPDGQWASASVVIELRPAEPESGEKCDVLDLSGTWTRFDDEKNTLRLTFEQAGCTLKGTLNAPGSTRSITARFDVSSGGFVGTAVETRRDNSGCSNRLDFRIEKAARRTITIVTSGYDCRTKDKIDEKSEWSRPSASAA